MLAYDSPSSNELTLQNMGAPDQYKSRTKPQLNADHVHIGMHCMTKQNFAVSKKIILKRRCLLNIH